MGAPRESNPCTHTHKGSEEALCMRGRRGGRVSLASERLVNQVPGAFDEVA